MNNLLLIAIEADKEAVKKHKPAEQHCKMADSVEDVQKAVLNIAQSVNALRSDVADVAEIAKVAANKKTPKPPKPCDYVMDVVRAKDGKIERIDVRAV